MYSSTCHAQEKFNSHLVPVNARNRSLDTDAAGDRALCLPAQMASVYGAWISRQPCKRTLGHAFVAAAALVHSRSSNVPGPLLMRTYEMRRKVRNLQGWGAATFVKRRSRSAGALCARSGPPHGSAISTEYTRKSVYGCHLRP